MCNSYPVRAAEVKVEMLQFTDYSLGKSLRLVLRVGFVIV